MQHRFSALFVLAMQKTLLYNQCGMANLSLGDILGMRNLGLCQLQLFHAKSCMYWYWYRLILLCASLAAVSCVTKIRVHRNCTYKRRGSGASSTGVSACSPQPEVFDILGTCCKGLSDDFVEAMAVEDRDDWQSQV